MAKQGSAPTYWDYLKLDRLLQLQNGMEPDDARLASDELHFIVVHQIYELWFKLVLRELRQGRDQLAAPRVPEETLPHVVHHLRRVNEILKLAADQFRVVETLTPQDFLDFRDKLVPASGFQSFQMREIELLLGLEEEQRRAIGGSDPIDHIRKMAHESPGGRDAWARVEAARQEKTLRSALHDWLHRTPIQASAPSDPGDAAVVDAFMREYMAAFEEQHGAQTEHLVQAGLGSAGALRDRFESNVRRAREFLLAEDVTENQRERRRRIRAGILFIESYRDLPLLAWPRLLVDTIVELEELLVIWRSRHARMAERVIGRRVGTGGSPGVDYLDQTAQYRIFVDLWSVRTLLLPREALPALRDPTFYGFAV
ncbi:MAG: tryptophan 2,3-dioxygenase [Candidatus Latescibacterota bacterium]|nr:MAG: tryptophan 2,3-dioxygenase [Candidatus Latescibacterota bacterium]